jgi:hypothetical protein
MKVIKIVCSIILMLGINNAHAQDDLLNELNTENSSKQITSASFKGVQICSMQSTKVASKNEWYFIVSHRFGDLTKGFDNFFGMDTALTKIGALYGATDWLTLGASRHTYNKTYELSLKYRFANQYDNGFPFTIVGYNTLDINSDLEKELYPALKGSDRLAFSTQLLISRKFSEKFSLEMNPIYIHKNLYEPATEDKDNFLIGLGGRYKISKRMSINAEYSARLNAVESTSYHNPLSIGLDIDTGGHIFQMVLSNSQAMNDVAYYSNASGNWNGGGIYFGFNMYRVF